MGRPQFGIAIAVGIALIGAVGFKVYERLATSYDGGAFASPGSGQPAARGGNPSAGRTATGERSEPGGPRAGGEAGRPGAGGRGFGGPILVAVAVAERREVIDSVEALGTATANESVTIAGKVTETVRRINFEDGQFVQAGDVLIELTDDEQTALLSEARANLDDARRQYDRLDDLATAGSVPMSQRDEAQARVEAARGRLDGIAARLGDRVIRAPFAGVLGFRRVSPGTLVTPNTEITTIDDIETIKLDFAVPETTLASIRPGLEVIASAAAWPGRTFEGVVVTLDSRVDPATRAITVRAHLPNGDRALRPGMLLTVRLVQSRDIALVVPESALLQMQAQRFVYTITDGRAQRIDVEIGRRRPGIVEIRRGLDAGTPVITEGVDRVRPNAPVQTADAGARGGPPSRSGAEPAGGAQPMRPEAAGNDAARPTTGPGPRARADARIEAGADRVREARSDAGT